MTTPAEFLRQAKEWVVKAILSNKHFDLDKFVSRYSIDWVDSMDLVHQTAKVLMDMELRDLQAYQRRLNMLNFKAEDIVAQEQAKIREHDERIAHDLSLNQLD